MVKMLDDIILHPLFYPYSTFTYLVEAKEGLISPSYLLLYMVIIVTVWSTNLG